MSALHAVTDRARSRPRLLAAVLAAAVGLLALGAGSPGPGPVARAIAEPPLEPSGELIAQTDASVPAFDVTMIGSSPREAPDEAWGIGTADSNGSGAPVLVRYAAGAGWSLGPGFQAESGATLTGFQPEQAGGHTSPLAGQMTPAGDGVLVGTAPTEGEPSGAGQPVLLVRKPGGPFTEVRLPSSGEAALGTGESLFATNRAPLTAPLEEPGGQAGAFVVPVATESSAVEDRVLHWDGSKWTSESIEVSEASHGSGDEGFRVLAIGASSAANAWLLAELPEGYASGDVGLFHRQAGEHGQPATWKPVAVSEATAPTARYPLTVPVPVPGSSPVQFEQKPFTVPNLRAQTLTVTSEGVWIDGERADAGSPVTMYFKGQSGGEAGRVVASWCALREGVAAGIHPCERELKEALPAAESRSFAWPAPGQSGSKPFGERIITGLPDGASLRLEGSSFRRLLALGGSEGSRGVGTVYGATFASSVEGWLGQQFLPVHIRGRESAEPSRLQPWPVTFSHALVAAAPQPQAPVGALTSEALAVGDDGEVARYAPNKGWLPESLFGPGQRVEKPRLRAVAWPTPERAYAVGDDGAMWLWRGEDDLWEPDPAAPRNFRGDLLGIAFDPDQPSLGYAVGQGGVLLRYGKSWTQEALPTELAGANFTSVAFAGSEAIAAYHLLPNRSENLYTGGLLVNEGSGWHVDKQAAAAMGENVPWAVAGLPDGGAAFVAGERSGEGQSGVLVERAGAGAPWQVNPTPLPGVGEPGSLALFREGGALRAILSGSVPNTYEIENPLAAPLGSPPTFIGAYPYTREYGAGHVVKQTATGWSDEEHEVNDVEEPAGGYTFYDTVYQPDPVSAVLINEAGTQGWAVGGFIAEAAGGALDTADIDRYSAQASEQPTGVGTSPLQAHNANDALFAIGGNAQCAAPCGDSANARIGPDVWLSSALHRAKQVPGVRAFLYTGPRLSDGETSASPPPFPFGPELERYAELLKQESVPAPERVPAYAAITPYELNKHPSREGSEEEFEKAFEASPAPFGSGQPSEHTKPHESAGRTYCNDAEVGCERAYYAFDSEEPTGTDSGTVRVIVLDESGEVDAEQLTWVHEELGEAREDKIPAIVVGYGNIAAEAAAGQEAAKKLAAMLVSGSEEGGSGCAPQGDRAGASAYFYDSPEQNIKGTLSACGEAIPTFGSGTLGYVRYTAEGTGEFIGASGFLLAEVDTATRNAATNRAEVKVQLIPNIGELALEARNGTLLRRSEVASFAALARRPRSGNRSPGGERTADTSPYIPIGAICLGAECPPNGPGILPEYTFRSSKPDIGAFVKRNPDSAEANAIALNEKGQAIAETEGHSDLFCAYNKGTTNVTIESGGLSSTLEVTVQAGSVRPPCGTVPLTEPQPHKPKISVPTAVTPTPVASQPAATAPPVIVPAPPVPPQPSQPAKPARSFFTPQPTPETLLAFVPPPLPTPARPTPPSGTSAVTSPVEAVEREEEQEEAIESVSNQAVAYRASEHELPPEYILGLVVLAAFAGSSIARRRPRRGRRTVPLARATIDAGDRRRRRSRRW